MNDPTTINYKLEHLIDEWRKSAKESQEKQRQLEREIQLTDDEEQKETLRLEAYRHKHTAEVYEECYNDVKFLLIEELNNIVREIKEREENKC